MLKHTFILIALLFITLASKAQTIIEKSGNITADETWTADTVKVTGDITVDDGFTLTINPGVYVEFQGYYGIAVQGRILAIGNVTDSITLTIRDTTGYSTSETMGCWNGIDFYLTPNTNDTSFFQFVKISYSRHKDDGGAIRISHFSKVVIKDCYFSNNQTNKSNTESSGGAIYYYGSDVLKIENCTFNKNGVFNEYWTQGGAIYSHWSNIVIINSNFICNGNGIGRGGAICAFGDAISIINCLFIENHATVQGGAISLLNGVNATICNCTFTKNTCERYEGNCGGDAICSDGYFNSNYLVIMNSILWNNTELNNQVYLEKGNVKIINSCVKDGMESIRVYSNSSEIFEINNINYNPSFVDYENNNLNLTAASLLINMGLIDTSITTLPDFDLNGNDRIINGKIDLGAFEYQSDPTNRMVIVNDDFHKFIDYDTLFTYPIQIISFPQDYNYRLIGAPNGMSVINDTLKWTPNSSHAGKTYNIRVIAENSALNDTLEVNLYVLKYNEYAYLNNGDITWNADTIKVLDNLTIKDSCTLTITPGTYIEFQDHYSLTVRGRLLALGASDERITFTAKDTILTDSSGGWSGILFKSIQATNDSSKIQYCLFEWGHSYNEEHGAAIDVYKCNKLIITNNIFRKCKGYGTYDCAVYFSYSDAVFNGNLIAENNCIGVVFAYNSDMKIFNNTVTKNNYGVTYFGANPEFSNCIIHGNYEGLVRYNYSSVPKYFNCNLQDILIFENGNINVDPIFNGSGEHPFQLKGSSPCINAGKADFTNDSIGTTDIAGNDRIYYGRIDIGAYEYNGSPIVLLNDTIFIAENTPNNSIIDTLHTKHILGKTVEITLLNDSNSKAFNLDNNSGIISVANSSILNFETNPQFDVIIKLDDGTNIDTSCIKIVLNDINEKGINPFQGFPRTDAISFTINDTVYVGLGRNADTVLNDFWTYNNIDDEWQQAEPFPGVERIGAVSFVINNKAYVGLGYNQVSNTLCNDFYSFNPDLNEWDKVADFGGTARSRAVTFVIGDTAYVGTGSDLSDNTNDFWKYSPASNEWTALEGVNLTKRSGAVAFEIDGKGYITGGSDYGTSLSDVQEYDPASNTWTEKIFADGLNLSFQDATAIVGGNKAFICYGNKDEVVSYKPSTNQVENLGDILNLGNNRFHPVSFILGDSAYFGLGYYSENISDEVFSNEILTLNLPFSYAPTNIMLSDSVFEENQSNQSLIGTLEAVDKNSNDIHIFELVSGEGGTDNNAFQINNAELLGPSANFEAFNQYYIRIKVSDSDNNSFEKPFTIHIKDVNEAPSDIICNNNSIDINANIGDTVCSFFVYDEDVNDTHVFDFVDDPLLGLADAEFYTIVDSILILSKSLNKDKTLHEFVVKATDLGGLTFEQAVAIYITDEGNSIMLQEASQFFTIYPNPSTGDINIKNLQKKFEAYELTVVNAQGKIVFKKTAKTSSETLHLNTLEAGTYFMILKSNHNVLYKKLIFE